MPLFTPFRCAFSGLCLAVSVSSASAETWRGDQDGVARLAWVVDGRTDTSEPAPLVLALHGFRRVEQALEIREAPERLEWTRLAELARANGFIAVIPAAYLGRWNMFPGMEDTKDPSGRPVDDEAFLLNLVAQFVADGSADENRLYLTGISDGAIMTYRMACLKETPFAAVAPLIGTAYGGHLDDCTPDPAPALLHVHGTHDAVLPYDGWIFSAGREVSVPEAMEHWRRLHGCTGQAGRILDDLDPEDGSTVGEMIWTGCTSEAPVIRYKIINGGHDIPALDAVQRDAPDRKINRDLDTMRVIWAFFARF